MVFSPSSGEVLINNQSPGIESKRIIAYLPERSYLNNWMKINDIISYFDDFYDNFSKERAYTMLDKLHLDPSRRLRTLSKGDKEKYSSSL